MTAPHRGPATARKARPAPTPRQPQAVRGWCPGALRPMESGDGLIVRVRPKLATLKLDAVRAIADAAIKYGNGIIDLTQRANLQIRGLRQDTLSDMHAVLRDHDLLDENAQAEQVRNILVSPLANLGSIKPEVRKQGDLVDIHPIARALEARLRTDNRLWALPGKFGFLLDSGSKPDLKSERADIHLVAWSNDTGTLGFKVGLDRPKAIEWIGTTTERDPEKLVGILTDIAIKAIESAPKADGRVARMRNLPEQAIRKIEKTIIRHLPAIPEDNVPKSGEFEGRPLERGRAEGAQEKLGQQPLLRQQATPAAQSQRPLGIIELDAATTVLALAAPFGSLDAPSWLTLLDAAQEAGISELRLSPWRTIYLPLPVKQRAANVLGAAARAGFITDPQDPVLRIDACPGAPRCASAYADTRKVALQIANHMTAGEHLESVHISGCAKGCARAAPADLMLTAGPDGFGVAHNATASKAPETTIPYSQLARLKSLLQRST